MRRKNQSLILDPRLTWRNREKKGGREKTNSKERKTIILYTYSQYTRSLTEEMENTANNLQNIPKTWNDKVSKMSKRLREENDETPRKHDVNSAKMYLALA